MKKEIILKDKKVRFMNDPFMGEVKVTNWLDENGVEHIEVEKDLGLYCLPAITPTPQPPSDSAQKSPE